MIIFVLSLLPTLLLAWPCLRVPRPATATAAVTVVVIGLVGPGTGLEPGAVPPPSSRVVAAAADVVDDDSRLTSFFFFFPSEFFSGRSAKLPPVLDRPPPLREPLPLAVLLLVFLREAERAALLLSRLESPAVP